ncbi:MAG TPA: alpha-glucosidase/alpha-galactosidase [Chloroflexota bacterium]
MPRSVRISVIGAGSGVFSLGLVKDLCLTPNLRGSEISFMDIDPERLGIVHNLAGRYARELGADVRFEQTLDREASLREADFVINTAYALGHHHARRVRETTERHGYYYGGLDVGDFHNFELMMSVARDMERICPDAWLIQSGNPVFDGCTLMTRETSLKIIGLCHGHYGYIGVCRVLGLDPARVTWEAPGLNHCIWLTQFLHEGADAYPILDQWIETRAEEHWRTHRAESTHDTDLMPGEVLMYRLYGVLPVGDTPRTQSNTTNWWFHNDLAAKKRWWGEPFGGPDTEVARPFYVANLEKRIRRMGETAADPKARVSDLFGAEKTREQQVPIIDALANNVEGRFQVNYPNRGVIEGIPDDVVAEFQAIIDRTGVHPIKPSPLPRKVLLEQVYPMWLDMERNLAAYRSGDRSMLLWNVLQSHQTRSYEQAVAVLGDYLAMEEHADLRRHFKGFDGAGTERWSGRERAPA